MTNKTCLVVLKLSPTCGINEAASIKDWKLSGVGIESVVGVLMVLVDMVSWLVVAVDGTL